MQMQGLQITTNLSLFYKHNYFNVSADSLEINNGLVVE